MSTSKRGLNRTVLDVLWTTLRTVVAFGHNSATLFLAGAPLIFMPRPPVGERAIAQADA
jgi:hypothetical protein